MVPLIQVLGRKCLLSAAVKLIHNYDWKESNYISVLFVTGA